MTVADFLKQRAVNLTVSGSYSLPNWLNSEGKPRNFACRTSRISPFRMLVDVPVIGRVGDKITSRFGDLGTLHGQISDTTSEGFLLELSMPRTLREKLSNTLKWVEMRQRNAGVVDGRTQTRVLPANPHSVLTFGDGRTESCFIIDMSPSGVAVSAGSQPAIGTPLAVGSCVGRVVRHLPDGFALQFVQSLSRADLDRRISRPALPHSDKSAPHSYEARRVAATEYQALAS